MRNRETETKRRAHREGEKHEDPQTLGGRPRRPGVPETEMYRDGHGKGQTSSGSGKERPREEEHSRLRQIWTEIQRQGLADSVLGRQELETQRH